MNTLRILLVVILSGLSSHAFAQQSFVYGYDEDDEAYRIAHAPDGGFFVGGRTLSKGNGSVDYWVVKLDQHAKPVWDSAYGTDDYDLLWSIEPTRDGGALLAGFSGIQFSGTESALMYKIDSVGRKVQTIDFNLDLADHAHTLLEIPTGGYYLAGHTDSEGDPNGDVWIRKLDDNFAVVWDTVFDRSTGEHAHDAAITPDGGLIILGHTEIGGFEKFWAIRMDSNGNQLWQKTFSSGSSVHDSPYEVKVTAEGNFAFFGGSSTANGSSSRMWLLVVDPDGEIIVNKHFGSGDSFAWSGFPTSEGGYVLVGYTSQGSNGSYDLYAVKTDAQGNAIWQKTYGTEGYEFGYAGIQQGDRYVFVGSTQPAQQSDLYVVVVDEDGNEAELGTASVAENSQQANSISVYPNPTLDRQVSVSSPREIQSVRLMDGLGRVVYEGVVSGTDQVTFNLPANVGAGAYILEARSVDGTNYRSMLAVQ